MLKPPHHFKQILAPKLRHEDTTRYNKMEIKTVSYLKELMLLLWKWFFKLLQDKNS